MCRRQKMTDRQYARGLHALACDPSNQTGVDKTWALHFLRRLERLFKNARTASKKRHGCAR